MMKNILLYGALLAGATQSLAEPVCEMRGATEYAVFETAKAQFLASDYGGFADTITAIMAHQRPQLDPAFAQLEQIVPNGFDSCATIVQRVDTGGMIQEITTFNIRGGTFPIAVYMMGFPVRGEMQIGLFSFNSSLEPVIEELR